MSTKMVKIIFLISLFVFGYGQEYTHQVTTFLTVLEVSLNSTITIHCSRVCGHKVYDRWILYHQDGKRSIINQNDTNVKEDFEEVTGVTLTLNRDDSCHDRKINYTLQIEDVTEKVDGLVIQCGARNVTDNGDIRLEATHKTELVVEYASMDTNFERAVTIGGSTTINCSRICGPSTEDYWRLSLNGTVEVFNKNSVDVIEDFEKINNVTLALSNEDYSGCHGNIIKYSLTLANISRKIDGLVIECGGIKPDRLPKDIWYAAQKTRLHIDNLYRQLISNSIFNMVVVNGSKATVNCSRPCDLHTEDSWLLQFKDDNFTVTKQSQTVKDIVEKQTGITLTLMGSTSTDYMKICEHPYSLTIGNINDNANGVLVTCGAHRTDSDEEWFASYSVKLTLENNTEVDQLTKELKSTAEELENKKKELETCETEKTYTWASPVIIAVVLGLFILTCLCCIGYFNKNNKTAPKNDTVTPNPGAPTTEQN